MVLGLTISPSSASLTVNTHSRSSRSANLVEKTGGMCCAIIMAGSGGFSKGKMSESAFVPPVEDPIATIWMLVPSRAGTGLIIGACTRKGPVAACSSISS